MLIRIPVTALAAVLASTLASAQPQVASNEVRLCEHSNYSGLCHSFYLEPNMRHRLVRTLDPSIDNKTSSIQVGKGVELFVFQHPQFQGTGRGLKSTPHLQEPYERLNCMLYQSGELWNDQISSLILTPAGQGCHLIPGIGPHGDVEGVYLESLPDSGGVCPEAYYPLPEDPSKRENRYLDLGPYMNKKADTAYLCGPLEVELYPEPHLKGTPVVIRGGETSTKAWFTLADLGFGNAAMSMIIRSTSGKIEAVGGPPPPTGPARVGQAAGEPHRAPAAVEPMEARPPNSAAEPGTPPDASELRVTGTELMTQPTQTTFEHGVDRPGGDYRSFDLPEPKPELCRDACAAEPACKAYSYVKPGIQGAKARCWLKSSVGPARRDSCCVSGVKP